MWRGGRTTSARRTGRSSSASRAALKSRPSMGDEKPVGPVGGRTRFVSRFQKRLRAQRNFGFATKSVPSGNGGYWGGQFTPRGTTYVFVNVVVAPRYVARVQHGSPRVSSALRVSPSSRTPPLVGASTRKRSTRTHDAINCCRPRGGGRTATDGRPAAFVVLKRGSRRLPDVRCVGSDSPHAASPKGDPFCFG